jgi:probable rRNA maturation factor
VVSAETARRRAPEFGWPPHQELTLYLVHGLLHLCGYDDTTPGEEQLMRRRESEVLALLGLKPRVARSQ